MPAVLIYGITAVAAQIILVRELLASFYGNELTIGIVMFLWLVSSAAGSAAAERKQALKNTHLIAVQIAIACMAPASLVLARWVRGAIGMQGQVFAPYQIFALCLVSVGPICFLLGFCFTTLLRRLGERKRGAVAVSRTYYLEAAGSTIAGILVSYVVLPLRITAFPVMMSLLSLGFLASWSSSYWRRKNIILALAVAALILTAIISPSLEYASSKLRWSPFRLVEERSTRYGLLSAVESGGEISVFESGLFSFSAADDFTPELISHAVSLVHHDPQRVLLLGGGVSGIAAELHGDTLVESITYVEINGEIVDFAEDAGLFNPTGYQNLDIVNADPRRFLASASRSYDLVISVAPDPVTAQFNRFYSLEFFRAVEGVLSPGGILAISVTSSENFMNPSQAALLSSLRVTMSQVFPEVLTTPGSVAIIMGSRDSLNVDPVLLASRLKERYTQPAFITEGFIRHMFDPYRLSSIQEVLDRASGPVNTDLYPKCYRYGLLLQQSRVQSGDSLFIRMMFSRGLPALMLVLSILAFGPTVAIRMSAGGAVSSALLYGVGALTGFIQMAATIVIMISFQSFFGYVYYQLSVLVASAMAGLALGGALGHLMLTRRRRVHGLLAFDQIALLAVLVVIAALFYLGAADSFGPYFHAAAVLVVSFLGGFQFPLLAGALFSAEARGGVLYAFDLAGASVGAIGASLVIVPSLGLPGAWSMLSVVAAAGLAMIGLHYMRRPKPA